jgi:hypothetical protein
MAASMPDVVGNDPVAVWKASDYLLVLVTDVKPLSARVVGDAASGLHYDAALMVYDSRIKYPRMYITLERSIGGQFFCRFTEAGLHENCGLVDMSVEAFAAKALEMFKRDFGYSGQIEGPRIAVKPKTPAAN